MRRPLRSACFVALAAALFAGVLLPATPGSAQDADTDAFSGLGAWVDVFDYVPAFLQEPGPPPVVPATVDDLDRLGVDTIYLQAAFDDERANGLVVDRRAVGTILQRAHDRGVAVVAWYYPQLVDPARDLRHLEALIDFSAGGEGFDGIGIDVESQQVPDVAERNQRLVRLAKDVREAAGDDLPVGAIVYPAVQLEVLNQTLWPDFPYKKLGRQVDVWMPMVYWTFRDAPYRDAAAYTRESVRRLRRNLDDPDAVVHPVGGLAESSTIQDYADFVRASKNLDAIGWSVYDVDTTYTPAWAYLRGDVGQDD